MPHSSLSLKERIQAAYQKRIPQFHEAWTKFPAWKKSHSKANTVAQFIEENPVISEMVELEAWAEPERFTKQARDARRRRMLAMLDETRAPLEVVPVMLAPFSKPGAPIKVETRELAITAVEAKQTDPNFSWQKFANQHCRCGKSKHDINCKERIRQAAMELQALLKRLNLEV